METRKLLRNVMLSSYVVFCIFLVTGCNTTDEPVEPPECRPKQQSCESGDEADRGYDPCLVNKNLPVCNT